MEHRHLNTPQWSAAAVDSALERGNLQDWRELFSAARSHPEIAALVLRVARQRDLGGASILAAKLVEQMQPELSELRAPAHENGR